MYRDRNIGLDSACGFWISNTTGTAVQGSTHLCTVFPVLKTLNSFYPLGKQWPVASFLTLLLHVMTKWWLTDGRTKKVCFFFIILAQTLRVWGFGSPWIPPTASPLVENYISKLDKKENDSRIGTTSCFIVCLHAANWLNGAILNWTCRQAFVTAQLICVYVAPFDRTLQQ